LSASAPRAGIDRGRVGEAAAGDADPHALHDRAQLGSLGRLLVGEPGRAHRDRTEARFDALEDRAVIVVAGGRDHPVDAADLAVVDAAVADVVERVLAEALGDLAYRLARDQEVDRDLAGAALLHELRAVDLPPARQIGVTTPPSTDVGLADATPPASASVHAIASAALIPSAWP